MNTSILQEQFSLLVRVLSTLQDTCTDCDIQSGELRQLADNRTVLFNIDLRSILKEQNIPISMIKQKLEIFKCFEGTDINLDVTETAFIMSDSYSSVKMDFAYRDYMNNKYIPLEEFNKRMVQNEEDILFSISISKMICDRIKNISKVFNERNINILFTGEECSITCRSSAKDNFAKFIDNIVLNKTINNKYVSIPAIPYIIDHDNDLTMTVYLIDNGNKCTCSCNMNIEDISMNLCTYAKVVDVNKAK